MNNAPGLEELARLSPANIELHRIVTTFPGRSYALIDKRKANVCVSSESSSVRDGFTATINFEFLRGPATERDRGKSRVSSGR